jgi:hypothetical protein
MILEEIRSYKGERQRRKMFLAGDLTGRCGIARGWRCGCGDGDDEGVRDFLAAERVR